MTILRMLRIAKLCRLTRRESPGDEGFGFFFFGTLLDLFNRFILKTVLFFHFLSGRAKVHKVVLVLICLFGAFLKLTQFG